MTRHKPRGDVLAYDATRGYRGELVETDGATMDSCGGMIRTAGDGDYGRRDFRTLLTGLCWWWYILACSVPSSPT